jgi:hypothetical protein
VSDRDLFDDDLDPQALEEQRAVRAMLSSLPDPGPVPPDVLDRITRTLRSLQQEQDAGPGPTDVGSGASVVPLRPRPHRALWLAAAAGLVLVGGGAVVSQLGSDTSAHDTAASVARSSGSTTRPAPQASTGSAPQATTGTGARGVAPEAASGHVYASGTDYRRADLVLKARALLTPGNDAPKAKQDPAAGLLGDAAGVAACVRAVGAAPGSLLAADLGTYEGRPAVVLVLAGSSGREVVVADRSCRPGPAARLTSAPVP